MKKSLAFIFVLILFFITNQLFAKEYKVAIFDYDIREQNKQSIAKYIQTKLLSTGLNFHSIDQFSGRENENSSLKILEKIESDRYDLVITITSDSMVPATHRLINTPWLFTNVNNPRFFGIRDMDKPGNNKSGVTYYVPVIKQLTLFNEIMSNQITKIGIIFDYYAKSRRAELIEFREAALKLNMKYSIRLAKDKNELPLITQEMLKDGVDAIILTSSGKIYDNIGLILKFTNEKKVPLFSVNKKAVEYGAICAIASDYYRMVDENLIPMVIDVLKNGQNPGNMPVQYLNNPLIYLNLTQAKKLGIKISDELKNRATKKY